MTPRTPDSLPVDAASAAKLAAIGLRLDLVDTADRQLFGAWLEADARGFHEPSFREELLGPALDSMAYRRTTGVWEDSSPNLTPVATVSSWATELTVSPDRIAEAWAISAVTVSPTAAGKGIARALLEGELRTAAAAGCPLAILTVSESTLYGRYGFGPSALSADWTVTAKRAKWTGPIPGGRVELVQPQDFVGDVTALHERVRLQTPGQIEMWARRWSQLASTSGEDPDRGRATRAARYLDEGGVVRGVMVYRVIGEEPESASRTLWIDNLTTETPDAAAALWRLAIEMPLVGKIIAAARPVDEPMRWQVSDFRAVTSATYDHLWTRILDVPEALAARSYSAPGSVALEVTDPLDYTTGTWLFEADADGTGRATRIESAPTGIPSLVLGISELSSMYLGGVSATTLADAGRVTELTPGSAAAMDTIFHSARVPWLPLWF